MYRSFRARRGAAAILTAISLAVLIGFAALCVDVAVLYVRKQAHVNACDAAALAGAQELPDENSAELHALRTAHRNLNERSSIEVKFRGNDSIEVASREEAPLFLAWVFGKSHARVGASARAISQIPNSVRGNFPGGLRPWALDDDVAFQWGDLVTLKLGSDTEKPFGVAGNFQAVQFEDGPGAEQYRENIKFGTDHPYRVGDILTSQPGDMVGPTQQGADFLVEKATQHPWGDQSWSNCTMDNPRVVILPIVDWDHANKHGRTDVPIRAFAAFYVQEFQGQNLMGHFLRYVDLANAEDDPNTRKSEMDGGVRVPTLIR